jgi:hypothetical protein
MEIKERNLDPAEEVSDKRQGSGTAALALCTGDGDAQV